MQKIITTFLAFTLFFTILGSMYYTNAQAMIDSTASEQEVVLQSDPDEAVCPDSMQRLVSLTVQNFYVTADEVLLTANLNSESLNYLFRNYRNAQNIIREAQSRFNDFETRRNENPELIIQRCIDLTNEARDNLRFVFMRVYTQVSQRKKDFLLFEKYDSINSKFELLQDDLTDINRGLQSFDDLFPCFVTSCISR